MRFYVKRNENFTTICIDEAVCNSVTAGAIKNFILDNVSDNDRNLIIDCTRVDVMDTVFLGAMVFALKKLKSEKSISFVYKKDNAQSSTIMLSSSLSNYFNLFDNLFDAEKLYRPIVRDCFYIPDYEHIYL